MVNYHLPPEVFELCPLNVWKSQRRFNWQWNRGFFSQHCLSIEKACIRSTAIFTWLWVAIHGVIHQGKWCVRLLWVIWDDNLPSDTFFAVSQHLWKNGWSVVLSQWNLLYYKNKVLCLLISRRGWQSVLTFYFKLSGLYYRKRLAFTVILTFLQITDGGWLIGSEVMSLEDSS